MLRLPPTTIALAMLEVQAYDCQNRWADRVELERDLRLRMSSLRVTSAPPSENPFSSTMRAAELGDAPTVNTGGMDKHTSSGLSSPQPQRPTRAGRREGSYLSHSSSAPSAMPSLIPTALRAEVVSEASRLPAEIPRPDSIESYMATDQASDQYLSAMRIVHVRPTDATQSQVEEPTMAPARQLPERDGLRESPRILRHAERRDRSRPAVRYADDPTPDLSSTSDSSNSTSPRSESTEAPDHPLRIYNDSLPASMQPQTPQNLPEARHQSRLLGAHTAPVPRRRPRRGYPSTARFRGLFDRIENSEEEDLYHEASQFRDDDVRSSEVGR